MFGQFLRVYILVFLVFPFSHGMFGYQGQEPIYDGRENLLGLHSIKGEDCFNAAIQDGQLPVVDRLIPPNTIVHFIEASTWKSLPGNTTSSLTLPTEEDFGQVGRPYADWAPPPYDKLPGSAWERVSIRVGSDADTTGLQITDKNIHAMKVRLWEGIVPISRNRWRQQGLNDLENFDLACQQLNIVVNAFAYLNFNDIQTALRDVFNNIAKEWKDFEDALNVVRAEGEPGASVTALWEEFIRIKWSMIVTRAHTWVLEHVNELRASLFDKIRLHEPESFDTYSTEQWNLTNKLHILSEIAGRAGFTIMLPMNDYTGYKGHEDQTDGTSPDFDTRKAYYTKKLKFWSRAKLASRAVEHGFTNNWAIKEYRGIADPEDIIEKYQAQVEAQEMLREQMTRHMTVPLEAEEWILYLKRQLNQEPFGFEHWGFVIYRITYGQTDEEWAEFMRLLQADVDNWGDGVMGADLVKNSAQLKWIDGRNVGIAEDSFKDAEKHFLAFKEEDSFQESDWQDDFFLAVDSKSVASYLHPVLDVIQGIQPHGDFAGFVTAVEADWSPGDHAEEAPGFAGRMRCAGSLIWSDLFALAKAQAAYPEDLWALAMHHPWQVYVGPVVEKRKELWDVARKDHSGRAEFARLIPHQGDV